MISMKKFRPKNIILSMLYRNYFFFLPDKMFLKLRYRLVFDKKLNLKTPKLFNEKIQWLKLYDRKDIYTMMVDKIEAKKYVANIIGKEYIVPTLGIYNEFDDIDFNVLPKQFVIKCNHDSDGLIICRDKSKLDIEAARKKINRCLKRNYYAIGREWPYKNVKPKILIEEYMEDKKTKVLRDYKFFCFNGIPKIMYISEKSHTKDQKIAFFDMDYNQLDIKRTDYNNYEKLPNIPVNFEKMKKLAAVLAKKICHLRVDFYEVNGKIYFGELTFHTGSGFISFEDDKWNLELGKLIDISKVNKNEK